MTRRLYYTDSYLTTFDATVVERADEGRRIYLDRTAFYPTSGGQPHDVGSLGGVPVVDVVDEGERIAHLLASPLPADGTAVVAGSVDAARRFDHMQQHTGQHLLSAVFEEAYGWATVSVHFGDESSTLDLDTEQLPPAQLAEAERRANAIVAENRPVTVAFEDAATAEGLRKASAREGALRVVTIAELDRSACGGTHVRATGEIGAILLRRTERIRRQTRVEFLCGARAVARARADFEAMTRVAAALSASVDDAPALVAAQGEQLRAAEGARRRLERELWGHRAAALYERTAAGSDGVRRATASGETMDELKGLAHALVELPRAVLVGTVADPPSVLVAASADSGLDAGKLLKEAVTRLGGRGGGSARIAQGSVPDAARLDEVVAHIRGGEPLP